MTVLRDYNETDEDVAQMQQVITIDPESASGAKKALNETIPIGLTGTAFQLRIEVTGTWAQIVSMNVGLMG